MIGQLSNGNKERHAPRMRSPHRKSTRREGKRRTTGGLQSPTSGRGGSPATTFSRNESLNRPSIHIGRFHRRPCSFEHTHRLIVRSYELPRIGGPRVLASRS